MNFKAGAMLRSKQVIAGCKFLTGLGLLSGTAVAVFLLGQKKISLESTENLCPFLWSRYKHFAAILTLS